MEKELQAYLAAKAAEEEAKQTRLAAESSLVAAVENDKLEGSKTVITSTHKIIVSNKLTRTIDYPAYCALVATLPEGLQFVDLKPEINITKLRHVEAVDPAIVALCITSKPAKPSITVKPIDTAVEV